MSRCVLFCGCGVLVSLWGVALVAAQVAAAGSHGDAATVLEKRPQELYAAEPLIVERLDTVYRYDADGTGSRLDTDVLRPQTEAAARSLSVLGVPYAAGSERVEVVYVRVRKGNGTVVTTPPSEGQDQVAPVALAAPLYSNRHVLRIAIRGLAAGDRLEYQVRTVRTESPAKGQFWGVETFGRRAVVLERSVELRVPAGKQVLVSSPKNPARVSEEGAEQVYRWSGSQRKPSPVKVVDATGRSALTAGDGGEGAADGEAMAPIAWTTFHNWAEVGDWYRALSGAQSAPTPELKARADAMVYGLTTPEDRIRALYRYVSTEVRSIDVPFGGGTYAPNRAGEVLENQYGNSNDKSALLVALLRAEGLSAATVLIGTGVEVDETVPAPGWFNHVMTMAGGSGTGEFWLDTEPEVAPFRMLDASLRHREGLLIPANGPAALRRTPAEPPFPAENHFAATATLNSEGALAGHVELALRGDEELRYREELRSLSPAQWDRLAELYTQAAALGGQPSATTADQADDTAGPLHLAFDLRQAPFGDWANFRVVPMEPGLDLPLTSRQEPPAVEIDFGGRRTDTAVSRMTLPPGYSADLPAAVHLQTPFASLDKVSRLEGGAGSPVLVTERTLKLTVGELPASEWPAYRKFLDAAARTEPWIQLTGAKTAGTRGTHAPEAGENDPEASDLVQQARESMAGRDWKTATEKLDRAKAINPRQAFLWSSYGLIAGATGQRAEAIADDRRELDGHPEEAVVSRLLAAAELRAGDRAAAVKVLQAAVAQNGRDEPTLRMLGALEGETDPAAAEATLRAGLVQLPDSGAVKLALGTVLVQEGKRDEGARLLTEVLSGSEQPEQLNDAAFVLAEASLALPTAEAASRRSIQMLNAASVSEGARGGVEAGLLRSGQLISTWDTYGWVLYREGNLSEAEPWLRAAWADSYGAEPGKHLAALLKKEGNAAEAARVWQMAGQPAARRPGERGTGKVPPAELAVEDGSDGGDPRGERRRPVAPAERGSVSAERISATSPERSFAVSRAGNVAMGTAIFVLDYALGTPARAEFLSGDGGLAGFAEPLAKLNTHTLIPPGSPAHLLRTGTLRCRSAGAACTFTLLMPGGV